MNQESSDFSFVTDEWESANTTLIDADNAMSDIADSMKEVVKNSLLSACMDGYTAKLLSDKYDEEVLTSVRQFHDILSEFNEANQKNLTEARNMAEDVNNIASS